MFRAAARAAGNFVQLRVLTTTAIEVSWNEVVNEYNKSQGEDIISSTTRRTRAS